MAAPNIVNVALINANSNNMTLSTTSGTGTYLTNLISVPGFSTLVISDKSSSFYLEENKSIGIKSGASNGLTVMCSWEEIS